ncbi:hypothetical protein [Colwellia sp. MB02u-6]|jgi:hypothetical protein|nr:hypothetical protein [Colwellia sp. MB02u-6]
MIEKNIVLVGFANSGKAHFLMHWRWQNRKQVTGQVSRLPPNSSNVS